MRFPEISSYICSTKSNQEREMSSFHIILFRKALSREIAKVCINFLFGVHNWSQKTLSFYILQILILFFHSNTSLSTEALNNFYDI